MTGIYEATVRGLEAGLRVEDIATFDLGVCRSDEALADVLAREDLLAFDYVPVRENARVVGVLERRVDGLSGRTCGDAARRLDESMLISAAEPLTDFVRSVADSPYRLVVRRAAIEGIVTRSDIQKLPVRLFVFALVTHLETLMRDAITADHPDDSWQPLLTKQRWERVEQKRLDLANQRLDPPLIELTDFCDKRDILLSGELAKRANVGKKKAKTGFERIARLRDTIAHASELPGSVERLRTDFVEVIESVEFWIETLSRRVEQVHGSPAGMSDPRPGLGGTSGRGGSGLV